MENKTTLFTVYSQKLAGYLMQNGFVLCRLVRDAKSGLNRFLFLNTEELQAAINQWQTNR